MSVKPPKLSGTLANSTVTRNADATIQHTRVVVKSTQNEGGFISSSIRRGERMITS